MRNSVFSAWFFILLEKTFFCTQIHADYADFIHLRESAKSASYDLELNSPGVLSCSVVIDNGGVHSLAILETASSQKDAPRSDGKLALLNYLMEC